MAVADEALGRPVLTARLLEHGPGNVLVAGKPWLGATIEQTTSRLELELSEIVTMLPLLRPT